MVKIAEINQVPPGTGKVVRVGGKAIALFNINGTFHALDNVCTHRGGPLGEGKVHGTAMYSHVLPSMQEEALQKITKIVTQP